MIDDCSVSILLGWRPAWHAEAACHGKTDIFYGKAMSVGAAKRICRTCPMQRVCLDDAIERGELSGIWGGLTGAERLATRYR